MKKKRKTESNTVPDKLIHGIGSMLGHCYLAINSYSLAHFHENVTIHNGPALVVAVDFAAIIALR